MAGTLQIHGHQIVFHRPGVFAAWPANNGLWAIEGREALVGFVTGRFQEKEGHNVVPPYDHAFARTWDGGENWSIENPPSFPPEKAPLKDLTDALPLDQENLFFRCIGEGYHGSSEGQGGYVLSRNRGRTWEGPYRLANLLKDPRIAGWEMTPRTAYLRLQQGSLLFFLSARRKDKGNTDRAFTAMMEEGGRRISFCGWIVPPEDPYRAVMPAPVALSPTAIVVAVRRRHRDKPDCWIDCFASEDGGINWCFLSKIGDTGTENGNPPALIRLQDGRLCCCYGNRTTRRLCARISLDAGRTWQDELILRDDFHPDRFGDADFGYPRLFQRPDGRLVTLYYWATAEFREHYIAATQWSVS